MAEARHASHPEIIKWLNRAAGHISKIASMIEDGRPCLEVAQQLQAVSCAVLNAKRAYIQDHIEHCLNLEDVTSAAKQRELFGTFKEMAKYL